MPKPIKLKIKKDKVTIEEGEDSFVGKLIKGCKGKIRIHTPFGKRVVKYEKKKSKGGLSEATTRGITTNHRRFTKSD